jgi:hypothetical protein
LLGAIARALLGGMERVAVESNSLRSIGYDAATRVLEIEFCSGRVYSYAGVPPELHAWLMRTPSKGGYFNRMIRDRFAMRDVTPAAADPDLASALRRSLDGGAERP